MANEPNELTDAAKAEIADAIRIVREDKHNSMLREMHGKVIGPTSPPGTPQPPPQGEPPVEPPATKKHGLFWGDRVEE